MQTGEILPDPTLEEKIDTAMKHLKLAVQEHGESSVIPTLSYFKSNWFFRIIYYSP